MAFDKNGWGNVAVLGAPDNQAGTRRNFHSYVTNDTLVQVATSDYFLSKWKNIKVGDLLIVSADIDGTPAGALYVFATSTSGGVTVTVFA